MNEPVRLFVASRFREDKEDIRIIRTFNADPSKELLYKKLPKGYAFTTFLFVPNVEDADFILIPQSMRWDTPEWRAYFEAQKAFAASHGKEIILFIGTDLSHRMHVSSGIAFKGSVYRSRMHENEIVSVPYAEDLSEVVPFTLRQKGEKPIVSFCGYAGFPDTKTHVKYFLKNSALDVASLVTFNPSIRVFKRGIYFRRKAITLLQRHPGVDANFIIRDTFAGNTETTRVDPAQARREYLDNMARSDFVLCPKGDGNYSVRFYETLSLGRIPVLIDTDMALPLEGIIDYSRFIVRIPHAELHRLGDIIADLYASLTDDEFIRMQRAAREVFARYLRYDSFFNFTLPLLKEKSVATLR